MLPKVQVTRDTDSVKTMTTLLQPYLSADIDIESTFP
jgi:hypothetical protein